MSYKSYTYRSNSVKKLLTFPVFFTCIVSWAVSICNAYMVNNNPHHRVETLDSQGEYQLEWLVDWKLKRVTFNCTVQTKGFIGFGLSPAGTMTEADILIGGVKPHDGKPYFSDRHGVGNKPPVLDSSQDWKLHSAMENSTHTLLSFSRDFETCDDQDYPITEDKISLIWAYGDTDDYLEYHLQNRGVFDVYLLHPDYTPKIIRNVTQGTVQVAEENSDLKVWTITRRRVMPSSHTNYMCTIHKAPRLSAKHHIVGLEVFFASENSKQHIHHIEVHRCHAPPGIDPRGVFEPLLNHSGQICLNPLKPTGIIPTHRCTEMIQGWASGSRPFFNPEHVGIPLGLSLDEYFMLQVHYDNFQQISNKVIDLRLDFFYTSKLRPYESGMLIVGHDVPGLTPSLLIPPSSMNHEIYGHCSSDCTKRMFPSDGIKIFGLNLHAHNSGRRLRLQHFREDLELPWISSDDNYSFTYQQVRNLPREVTVLPGDTLIMKCVYDNTWTNGTVTGGFTSHQEMCLAIIYYYNKLNDYVSCRGQPDPVGAADFRRNFLGFSDIIWDDSQLEFVATAPKTIDGLTVSHISNNYVSWNTELRNELQYFQQYHPQSIFCPKEFRALSLQDLIIAGKNNTNSVSALSTYPIDAVKYNPKMNTCTSLARQQQ